MQTLGTETPPGWFLAEHARVQVRLLQPDESALSSYVARTNESTVKENAVEPVAKRFEDAAALLGAILAIVDAHAEAPCDGEAGQRAPQAGRR
jgi:hypothetical protein